MQEINSIPQLLSRLDKLSWHEHGTGHDYLFFTAV
jgi:hypothetical protein